MEKVSVIDLGGRGWMLYVVDVCCMDGCERLWSGDEERIWAVVS